MISEILYYVFVFPLESMLGSILTNLFMATKSYGLSIIILSLLVNIFLLKIFILTDKKAEFEAERKKRLDSRIKAWKSVYKKAKLFAFTQTLYRQNHYHPIYALSGLGGLALQIPFFYAMYFVIKNAEVLNGVSFLWISDLSLPDSVFGIHLLPILMTIISLINVWIVAKEKGAKIQGGLISLIFLVLLYAMPSALVLYWSTNMAFSLIRALWSKWCGNSLLGMRFRRFAKSPQGTDTKSAILVSIRQKLQKPHRNNFDCVKGESKSDLSLRESATLSKVEDSWQSAGFVSKAKQPSKLAHFFIHRKGLKRAVFALNAILIVILLAFGALKLSAPHSAKLTLESSIGEAKMHYTINALLRSESMTSNIKITRIEWDSTIDSNTITLLGNHQRYLNFFSKEVLNLKNGDFLGVVYFTMDNTPLLKNLFKYYFSVLGAILGIYLLLCIIERFQSYSESYAKIYRQISIYAIVCIAFLICVFTPYQLYSTDITQFDSTQTYATLSALFGAFVLISFMVIYALSFVPKRFSNIIAFALSVILFSGIVYSFILVGDYGAMDHFVLQKAPEKSTGQIFEFIAVLLLGITLMTFALKKLKIAMQIILATLFIVSGVNALQIVNKRLDSDKIDQQSKINDKSKPPYADSPLFSYSKNDKNIVVIVLDMFSGSHTPYILEQFPEFKTQLDGFTLFPNALSTTNATAHSIATLIGGEYYAIYNMNKRKNNLAQEIRQGYENTGVAFANSGFSVSYMSDMYSNLIDNPKIHLVSDYKIFEPYFYERHNLKNAIESYREQTRHYESLDLISFGLFRFAPKYRAREKIYNNGDWLYDKMPNLLAHIAHASNTYAPTHIIRIDSNKPTFKFFHTSMTHFPFAVYFNGKECEFGGKKSAWNDYPHEEKITDKQFFQHYDSEACAMQYLTEYINLLKNVGIYDNTQIFVVSDHGGDVSFGTPKFAYRPDVLFLFKDFGTRGNLKIDNRLMANYDAPSIFCANLVRGCPNVPPNILQNYPNNREIIYMMPYHWILEKHKPNEWLINKAYKVKDNIYDPKNWINISDESYGIVNVK